MSTLTYRALAIHQPPYLASHLHFSNIPRQPRSSTSQQLYITGTKLNLGKCAVSVDAKSIWSELPTMLKLCESLASFHKRYGIYLHMEGKCHDVITQDSVERFHRWSRLPVTAKYYVYSLDSSSHQLFNIKWNPSTNELAVCFCKTSTLKYFDHITHYNSFERRQ